MANPAPDSNHVAGLEFDCLVIEVDEESAFQSEKALVGIGVTVPVTGHGHHADADFMIVDRGDGMVVVSICRCRLGR